MKILILRSAAAGRQIKKDNYSVRMNTNFAERFVKHLTDKADYCKSCADDCVKCRKKHNLDFSKNIIKIIEFPSVLPVILDDPGEYIPDNIPDHDILIAIAVNEEIFISFIEKFSNFKAVIVPIEGSDWISGNAVRIISDICKKKSVEYSFPKPFCSFNPENGILLEFKRIFKIGLPDINFTVKNSKIADTSVITSAPCGATYYTANCLKNAGVDDNLSFIIDKSLSCYPCTSSTAVDREFNDSIIHQACKIQKKSLTGKIKKLINAR